MAKRCKKCGLLNFDEEPACVACGATDFEPLSPVQPEPHSEPAAPDDKPVEIEPPKPVQRSIQIDNEPREVLFESKSNNVIGFVLLNLAIGACVLLIVFGIVRYFVFNGLLPD